MNRRNFIGSLAKAFTILPAATTYSRMWVPERRPIWVPATPDILTFLDIQEWQRKVYEIARKRGNPPDIDMWVDSETAEQLKLSMQNYYDENGVLRPEEPREPEYEVINGIYYH